MARSIIGVIVGYLVMFVLVSATFMGVFFLLGTDWSFKPGSFAASNRWIAMSLIANLIIGVIGGLVCAVIAKGGRAPLVLAILVFALGLLLAIPSVIAHKKTAGEMRGANVSQNGGHAEGERAGLGALYVSDYRRRGRPDRRKVEASCLGVAFTGFIVVAIIGGIAAPQ